MKTALAEMAFSEEISTAFTSFQLTVEDLQTLVLGYVKIIQNLGYEWEAVSWMIYSEPNTQPFYQRLNEDIQLYLANLSDPESSEFYSTYLRDLLGMSVEKFSDLPTEQLYAYMNADFPRLEWVKLAEEIQLFFKALTEDPNISMMVRNSAAKFAEALDAVQQSLHVFLMGNQMDLKFHR